MVDKQSVKIQIRRLEHAGNLPLPSRATSDCAGFDIRAAVEAPVIVEPGEAVGVPAGFQMALPSGYEAQVRPRSGLALKSRILIPNSPGTIDADYRGEVVVIVMNGGKEPFLINRGDRIAQMVISKLPKVVLEDVDELPGTERGAGGFGHTGVG